MNGFLEILGACVTLLAGTGVFLFGMKTMSDGLDKYASKGMRKLFSRVSNNRFIGLGIGTLSTTVVRSSTAISVMVLGLVNSGIMNLFQATSVIMGANIGTTFDSLLYIFPDLFKNVPNFDITAYLALLAPIGVILTMIDKKEKTNRIGESLAGMGLLFIGLSMMSGSFSQSVVLEGLLTQLFQIVRNPFLLILIGMVVTALVHSSHLLTAVIIILVRNIPTFEPISAFYLILGSNIGTCFTAVIASIGTSTNAKRTAFIHIFFNFIGVVLFLAFMLPAQDFIANLFVTMSRGIETVQVSLFHIVFNVVSAVVFLPFVKQIVWIAEKVIPEKKQKIADKHFKYLDQRLLETPSVAVAQLLKEISAMAVLAQTNYGLSMEDVINAQEKNSDEIAKNEKELNYLNHALLDFMAQLSTMPLSRHDEKLIGSLYHVVSDIERIGDHAENFLEFTQQMGQQGLAFTDNALKEISSMHAAITEMFKHTLVIFDTNDLELLPAVVSFEEQVDKMNMDYADNHISRLKQGICSVESGKLFYEILSNLERVADHLINIAYSVKLQKPEQYRMKRAKSPQSKAKSS